MVTYELLREHIGRRPFVPFRIVLKGGEVLEVVRMAQAVALKQRVFVGSDTTDDYRMIPHDLIDHLEVAEFKQA